MIGALTLLNHVSIWAVLVPNIFQGTARNFLDEQLIDASRVQGYLYTIHSYHLSERVAIFIPCDKTNHFRDSLVVIWEGLTAAVVMSSTIFRIHKKPSSLHGADYKRNEEFHHVFVKFDEMNADGSDRSVVDTLDLAFNQIITDFGLQSATHVSWASCSTFAEPQQLQRTTDHKPFSRTDETQGFWKRTRNILENVFRAFKNVIEKPIIQREVEQGTKITKLIKTKRNRELFTDSGAGRRGETTCEKWRTSSPQHCAHCLRDLWIQRQAIVMEQ
ncbi:hypothetical protein QTP88_021749 [Uroleucon formosanum]